MILDIQSALMPLDIEDVERGGGLVPWVLLKCDDYLDSSNRVGVGGVGFRIWGSADPSDASSRASPFPGQQPAAGAFRRASFCFPTMRYFGDLRKAPQRGGYTSQVVQLFQVFMDIAKNITICFFVDVLHNFVNSVFFHHSVVIVIPIHYLDIVPVPHDSFLAIER